MRTMFVGVVSPWYAGLAVGGGEIEFYDDMNGAEGLIDCWALWTGGLH
jgi:hypothetical protein